MTALVTAGTSQTLLARGLPSPPGQPDAHHPRRLGHVDRGHPLEHPLVLLVLDNLRFRLAHRGHLRILGYG